jgi:hypothetical protein
MASGARSGPFGQHTAPNSSTVTLAKYRFVPQRLENLAVKLGGEVYCACNPVVELDEQRYCESGATFTTRGII